MTRLDSRAVHAVTVPETRYIARSPDRAVLLGVPLPGADPQRFVVEASPSTTPSAERSSPVTGNRVFVTVDNRLYALPVF
ncbi:hypothetical protein EOT10_21200 [Streptomyces antnestii]|uniref:Uncharacterized protein n=1 Tax=Streptomyces antnestii TaxID=2494256 RepID=A0A3S2VE79_9ACTN|nr:hypothetical protein [Streptomyces sp. San01]RVU22486.1 hypothetical protein EOT10_21200 [Streptomyces sp. San01]